MLGESWYIAMWSYARHCAKPMGNNYFVVEHAGPFLLHCRRVAIPLDDGNGIVKQGNDPIVPEPDSYNVYMVALELQERYLALPVE